MVTFDQWMKMNQRMQEQFNITNKFIEQHNASYRFTEPLLDYASSIGAESHLIDSFESRDKINRLAVGTLASDITSSFKFTELMKSWTFSAQVMNDYSTSFTNAMGVESYRLIFNHWNYAAQVGVYYTDTIPRLTTFIESINVRTDWTATDAIGEIQELYEEVQDFPITEESINSIMESIEFQHLARNVLYPFLVVFCVINYDLVYELLQKLAVIYGIAAYFKPDKKA